MNSLIENIEHVLQEEVVYTGSQRLRTASGKEYFLKNGRISDIYRCEANGLKELALAQSIEVAKVVAVGKDFILTEYIHRGKATGDFFMRFGRELARMHRYQSDTVGFHENNYIGANEQINIPSEKESTDWIDFYYNKRLMFQFRLAERNGYATSNLRNGLIRLEKSIESILSDGIEHPCLLHGDLWAGNFICDENGRAVLIDPAVYYGHREADLAMTKLFGGFSCEFYDSYQKEYPLKPGWEYREGLYKLYHVLNHLNLFGRSYLHEAESLLNPYG
ncbi:MAG: fructosamine kinase family protein [Tannerella sp.]|jgi:fructosamine-3-kinase|nr:fructosamine kinase family protein [Tannerella sp.]